MRLWGILVAASAVATLALAAPATATATAAPSEPASAVVVERIPAFDDDLPVASQSFGEGAAGSRASAPDWVCSINAGVPWKSGSAIRGSGFQSCSGPGWRPQRVDIVVQKYRGVGVWNNMGAHSSTGWTNNSYASRTASWSCAGQGTQTYRLVADGYADGGLSGASAQSGEYIRVTC